MRVSNFFSGRKSEKRSDERDKRRTVGDGGHEAVHGDGSVEDHLGRHGLLAHEVATYAPRQRQRQRRESSSYLSFGSVIGRKVGGTDLSTRASEVRPAIAMPT